MYKENFVILNAPVKFRDFRETGPVASQGHVDRDTNNFQLFWKFFFFAWDH